MDAHKRMAHRITPYSVLLSSIRALVAVFYAYQMDLGVKRIELVRSGIWSIRLARTPICGQFGAQIR